MTDLRHKLTEDQVRDIRAKYAQGNCTQPQLATEYGVSDSQINKIVNNDQWRDVGISMKRPPIKYRKEGLVKPLRCPVCNGEIVYDTAYCDLMCANKLKGKCTFGISITDDREEPYFLWSVRGSKKVDYKKFGELVKEINRRRSRRMKLANNLLHVPREDKDEG